MVSELGIELRCRHCGQTIESVPPDRVRRWTHHDSDDTTCTGDGVTQPDVQRLYDDVIDLLDPTYTLVYIDQGDGLNPSQIRALLDGDAFYESAEFSHTEEWVSEARWQAATEIIRDLVDVDSLALLESADLDESLRQEIYDRDDSDVFADLLRNSGSALFRFDLDLDVPDASVLADPDEWTKAVSEIADAAGLDVLDPRVTGQILELIDHATYGGNLYVLWYTDPDSALDLASPATHDPTDPTDPQSADQAGMVVFTGAHLAVIDHFNGSGHTVAVDMITADWAPRRVSIDAPHTGPGYSWHDIAGPVASAYSGHYTRSATPRNGSEHHA